MSAVDSLLENDTVVIVVIGIVAAILIIPNLKLILQGAVTAVDDVVSESVQSIGEVVGVPRTDTPDAERLCQEAIAKGDSWNASLYCPAPTYFKYMSDKYTLAEPSVTSSSQLIDSLYIIYGNPLPAVAWADIAKAKADNYTDTPTFQQVMYAKELREGAGQDPDYTTGSEGWGLGI